MGFVYLNAGVYAHVKVGVRAHAAKCASAHKTNHSNLSRTEIASEPPSRFESLIMMLACASIYLRVSRYNS